LQSHYELDSLLFAERTEKTSRFSFIKKFIPNHVAVI